jgi:hypothetical protein
MHDWNSIKQEVEKNGNVLTVSMETLREATGAGKLGVHICRQISQTLVGMGLGHVPQELPSYQYEQVRLYKRGTPVGDVIELVLAPGQQNDEGLRQKFGANVVDYGVIIAKIRELVSE